MEIYFQWYAYKQPFDEESKRLEILERLNEIEGVSLPEDAITRRPSISLSFLADSTSLEAFFGTYEWFLANVKAAHA